MGLSSTRRAGLARRWPVAVQGAVEMVTSGGYDVAYSLTDLSTPNVTKCYLTLTNHATSAMHEHAVDMFGLHWLGRRARL